ncbi:MAG: hypothetical protein AAGD11_03720 [Planctomycetota bacterium]
MSFSPADFGPVFAELLDVDRLRDLDEGSPQQTNHKRLQSLSIEQAFAHVRVVDNDHARCCLSAIWLLYDFLEDSHAISQGVATAEGSFWHGIMHRREGDYSNAKYWFRKVGQHPVYAQLADDWDPHVFVDACQAALRDGGDDAARCRQLQQQEWEQLFEYCFDRAIAG